MDALYISNYNLTIALLSCNRPMNCHVCVAPMFSKLAETIAMTFFVCTHETSLHVLSI